MKTHSNHLVIALAAATALAATVARAVTLGAPFENGMVLQRGMEAPVRGTARPGETVTVEFAGQTKSATADAESGAWCVRLDPMEACAEGREMVVRGSSAPEKPVVLRDVLVGEVWLVCGQSNATFGLRSCERTGLYLAQAVDRPFVRLRKMGPSRQNKSWAPMEHGTDGAGMSALAWCFALELHDAIGIPVGVLQEGILGASVNAFLAPEMYAGFPERRAAAEGKDAETGRWWGRDIRHCAPLAVRGLVWYQGETNADEGESYKDHLHALLDGWAEAFGDPDMEMYVVELAAFKADWFGIRQGQRAFCREAPRAAFVPTCDIGDPGDIHPKDKRAIAQRAVLHALRRIHGRDWIRDDPPDLVGVSVVSNRVEMTFTDADGWHVMGRVGSSAVPFEVKEAEGAWHAAQLDGFGRSGAGARASTNAVISVHTDDVAAPKGVRYLFSPPGEGYLRESKGLPLCGFIREWDN